jgi:hypothetical protein
MDLVRFTGEWAVYYALIALGGGVLLALSTAMLTALLVAGLWTGGVLDIDRDLLTTLRPPARPGPGAPPLYPLGPGPAGAADAFDRLQLVLLLAPLTVDLLVLLAMVDGSRRSG